MIKSAFSHIQSKSFFYATLLTLVVCVVSFISVGYVVGVHDQGVYIPFVRKMLEPASYPGDYLVGTLNDNTILLWPVTLPLFRVVGIEWGMFILQVLAYAVFLVGVYYLITGIAKNKYLGLLAVNICAFRKLTFFTITTFNDYFAPRFLALGFSVWALHFALQKRWILAAALLVVACYTNMIVGLPLLGAVLLATLINHKEIRWQQSLGAWIIGILGLLPIVIFRLTSSTSGVSFGVDQEWFNFVRQALYVFFIPPTLDGDFIGVLGNLLGFSYVLLTPLLLWKVRIDKLQRNLLLSILGALVGVFVVNYFFMNVYPITILMQLQLTRVSIFFPILFYIAFTLYVWQRFHNNKQLLAMSALWGYTGLGAIWLGLVSAGDLWRKIRLTSRESLSLAWGIQGLLLAVFFVGAINLNPNSGLNIFPKYSPELDVQNWLRYNTTSDAKIVAPINTNELYTPNFRVFSVRSVLVTNSELGVAAVATGTQDSLIGRLDDTSKGEFSRLLPTKNYGKIFAGLERGYNSLTIADFRDLAAKYDLDYVITQKSQTLPLDFVYGNEAFNVYAF